VVYDAGCFLSNPSQGRKKHEIKKIIIFKIKMMNKKNIFMNFRHKK
jgi:hypothetical protein